MKWALPSAAVLSILFVNLHAQQPSSPPNTSGHSTRVLTGCLRAGPAPETYRLTDATPSLDTKELAGQPVGTSGQKAEYDVAADTGLEHGGPAIELKPHVGQQVELTVRPAETAVAPPAHPTAQSAAEVKATERKPARVIVTGIKSLSSSCS